MHSVNPHSGDPAGMRHSADLDVGCGAGSPDIELASPAVIIGAGTIGRMIAERFLLAGQRVHLIDRSQEQLDGARASIESLFDRAVRDEARRGEFFDRFRVSAGDLSSDPRIAQVLQSAICVIEALPEVLELKRKVLGDLDGIVPKNIPITTVSSSFPVSELLSGTTHTGRFLNSHPLQRGIDAIEMMPSRATRVEITSQVSELFSSIGMVPIEVQRENVGFIFNILWKGIKETALDLVAKGVAAPHDVDRLWMMALKTKIGPFGLMDMVGLDVVRDIEARYAEIIEGHHKPPPSFLQDLVREGHLGVKTGKGFYDYPAPAYSRPGFIERGVLRGQEEITPTRDTLLGTWELVSFTAKRQGESQALYPMGSEAQGRLMYGADGAMSVYLTRPTRAAFTSPDPFAATADEKAAAFSEFFTYFGGFRYSQGIVYHDVVHCSFPNWQGTTVIRGVSLDADGILTLSTPPFELAGSVSVQELKWRRAR